MPLDSFFISAQSKSLNKRLEGARIDKIFMPRPGEVVISLRTEFANERLMISQGGSNSGVYMTALKPENPPAPPMMCMLLRKHMQGGRIISVEQPHGERMMTITFSSTDELGRMSEKKLICELIGRHTNIILLDENGVILGCVKKVDYETSDRAVLPGLIYRMPPRKGDKPFVFDMTEEEIAAALEGARESGDIMERLDGISPIIARELIYRKLNAQESAHIIKSLADGEGQPWLVRKDGKDFDICCMEINQYGEGQSVKAESFSQLMDDFYRVRRHDDLKKNLSASLKKNLENHRNRIVRKLAKQKNELLTAQNRETLKKNADLIKANLYDIRSGDKKAVVTDYFTEGMPLVEIPLDPDVSPQENAQLLYKRYARLKNAEAALNVQIENGEAEAEYIDSLLYGLEQAESEKEIRDLTQEASLAGYVKRVPQKKNKPEKQGAFAPKRYVTKGGFTLLRGRNNRENDKLTMKTAKGMDIWFHARNIPGSHVIMSLEGLEPSDEDIREAAALAAFWSKAKNSGKAAVDYTRAKHVKKPQGARPGMVNYFEFKTIIVEPADMDEK